MNNNLLEITKTNSDCAQYTGTVTVATYLGDRLIQKETYHNEGLQNLFEFIGSCLQGNWHEARDKRPCKLVMLAEAEGEQLDASDPQIKSTPKNRQAIDGRGEHYWGAAYAVCSPVMYDTAAISETAAEGSSTTYHFRVPFLSLVGGSKIKKLMLLPPNATSYQVEACAYYILDKEIVVPDQGANYTIIIDWTLEFTNNTAT